MFIGGIIVLTISAWFIMYAVLEYIHDAHNNRPPSWVIGIQGWRAGYIYHPTRDSARFILFNVVVPLVLFWLSFMYSHRASILATATAELSPFTSAMGLNTTLPFI